LNLERDGLESRGVDPGLKRRQFGVDGAQAAPSVIVRISAHRGRHFRLIVDSISA
jgi:hypothetical protein